MKSLTCVKSSSWSLSTPKAYSSFVRSISITFTPLLLPAESLFAEPLLSEADLLSPHAVMETAITEANTNANNFFFILFSPSFIYS